jgi:hypothetical protein
LQKKKKNYPNWNPVNPVDAATSQYFFIEKEARQVMYRLKCLGRLKSSVTGQSLIVEKIITLSDKLAREGSDAFICGSEPALPLSGSIIRLTTKKWAENAHLKYWNPVSNCPQIKLLAHNLP